MSKDKKTADLEQLANDLTEKLMPRIQQEIMSRSPGDDDGFSGTDAYVCNGTSFVCNEYSCIAPHECKNSYSYGARSKGAPMEGLDFDEMLFTTRKAECKSGQYNCDASSFECKPNGFGCHMKFVCDKKFTG